MTDVTGTWLYVVNTPMGRQESTLTLRQDGQRLTGENVTAMGTIQVEDGRIESDSLSWIMNMKVPFPMKLEVSATVDADGMTGGVKAGMFGTSPMTATRKD